LSLATNTSFVPPAFVAWMAFAVGNAAAPAPVEAVSPVMPQPS